MKNSSLGLAIAAVAFGASTVYLAVQLREERERAEQVLTTTQALNARIAELERARQQFDGVPAVVAGNAPVVAAPPGAVPAIPASEPARAGEPPPVRLGGDEPSDAMRKMMRTQLRAQQKRMYGDLGARLGLTAEETNRLIDLLTDQQIADMELARLGRRSGAGAPDGALQPTQRQKHLDEIAALIGQDKMPEYQEYLESIPARQEVDMLARQLEGNDLTLSKQQRDRLISALAEERRRVPVPELVQTGTPEEHARAMTAWNEDYQERAGARARGILSGDQLETYEQYQQWALEMRRRFETRRAQRGDGNVVAAEPVTIAVPPPR